MRSFSNIMPNFAANLHLLVDSIYVWGLKKEIKKSLKYFVIIKKSITFALAFAKNGVSPSGSAKREESVL